MLGSVGGSGVLCTGWCVRIGNVDFWAWNRVGAGKRVEWKSEGRTARIDFVYA